MDALPGLFLGLSTGALGDSDEPIDLEVEDGGGGPEVTEDPLRAEGREGHPDEAEGDDGADAIAAPKPKRRRRKQRKREK